MRPSDVPTYVEAGAADLGITGKDVLMERAERGAPTPARSTSCSTWATGAAGWSWPRARATTPPTEALRRLGVMRIATKYPRLAARHFEDTGRQAEIVEVKGSVELAPLTGLVEGIVDLTATGQTLAQNGLTVREEIARVHGAPDRQPRGPQAQGGVDRRPAGARARRLTGMRLERIDLGDRR